MFFAIQRLRSDSKLGPDNKSSYIYLVPCPTACFVIKAFSVQIRLRR